MIKALWLCNMAPSFVARELNMATTNKEGWIAGMAAPLLKDNRIKLAVAFPSTKSESGDAGAVKYYSFYEDSLHPEEYDDNLEKQLDAICQDFKPDVIHCFGTEYPHTLGMLKNESWRKKTLIHLQGLMEPYADSYNVGLPDYVIKRATFRDWLKKDAIWQQKEKYEKRAAFEKQVLGLAVNVCGRTDWDRSYIESVNSAAHYYKLNETLRSQFYYGSWDIADVKRHSIFVTQGNYPLKGIHFVIKALKKVKEKYRDVKVYVTGDNVTRYSSLKEKIKISSYGKYIIDLANENGVSENIVFLGQKTAEEIKELLQESEIFLIPSVLENSPNSLGEAMLLGVPVIAARSGGIPTMTDESSSLMYDCQDTETLSKHILTLFENDDLKRSLSEKAREKAANTHSRKLNYENLVSIYENIAANLNNIN